MDLYTVFYLGTYLKGQNDNIYGQLWVNWCFMQETAISRQISRNKDISVLSAFAILNCIKLDKYKTGKNAQNVYTGSALCTFTANYLVLLHSSM